MSQNNTVMALDIGDARVGVALADEQVGIAVPQMTIELDKDDFRETVETFAKQHSISKIVIGYPRNQSGESTQQTKKVEAKASELQNLDLEIIFQDESLTSVIAEDRLKKRRQPYTKADIDAEAAAIILQDYLELRR